MVAGGQAYARCAYAYSAYEIRFELLSCQEQSGLGLTLEARLLEWNEVEKGAGLGWLDPNLAPETKMIFYASLDTKCSDLVVGNVSTGRARSHCCDGGGSCMYGVATVRDLRQVSD